MAQAIDGHHAGMIEPAGDFRLELETPGTLGIVGLRRRFVQGHFAAQFFVAGHEDLAQTAASMQFQGAIAARRSSARPPLPLHSGPSPGSRRSASARPPGDEIRPAAPGNRGRVPRRTPFAFDRGGLPSD